MESEVEVLQAVQQGVQQIKANCYSDNDGDSWRDCPDDCYFVEWLKVGDTFELQASVRSWSETFRVTKAPDDENDDYEVELVSSDAPFATHPTQQGLEQAIEVLHEAGAGLECAVARLKERAVVGDFKTSEALALEAVRNFLAAQAKQGEQANG